MKKPRLVAVVISVSIALTLAACSSGGDGDPAPAPNPQPTYLVGGAVAGLAGTGLTLQLAVGGAAAGSLNIAANGNFSFTNALANGATYAVTVTAQPSGPAQNCTVTNGSGTITGLNVSNVSVSCATQPTLVTVGGSVSGLNGTGLVLQNNGGNDLAVAANGAFVFATAINSGGSYAVTVRTQPSAPIQRCQVSNGSGTNVIANVSNIAVTCADVVPRFVYTMNSNSGTFSTFRVEAATGELRAVGFDKVGVNPIGFRTIASPTNANLGFAYTLNLGSTDISGNAYDRVTSGGATPIPGLPLALPSAPSSFTSHPNNRFLYVTHGTAGYVTTYAINETSGALTAVGGTVAAGTTPSPMTFSPGGEFAYVVNVVSNDIYTYAVNGTTGVLTEIPSLRVPTGGNPRALIFLAGTNFAYLASGLANTIAGFSMNTATGALTHLTGSPFATGSNPLNLMPHPNGNFLYLSNAGSGDVSAYAINRTTGVLTPLAGSPFPAAALPGVILFDSTGRFMYVSHTGVPVPGISGFRVDGATGIPASMGPLVSTPPQPRMTLEASGKYLYAASNANSNITSFRINQTTGELTPFDTMHLMSTGGSPLFATASPASTNPVTAIPKHVYVANDGGAGNGTLVSYAVNATTGALSAAGSTVSTGVLPVSVTSRPDNKFVYVANEASNTISVYASNNGALTPIVGSPFPTSSAPTFVSAVQGGRFVYAIQGGSIAHYSADDTTGVLAPVGTIAAGTSPASIAVDHNTRCLFAANNGSNTLSAYSINAITGALATVPGSPYAVGTLPIDSLVHPSGRWVYVTNDGNNTVSAFVINITTTMPCTSSQIAGSPYSAGPGAFGLVSIAAEPSGRFVYAANEANGTVSTFAVNQTTGALTLMGAPVSVGTSATAVFTEASGKFLYVSRQVAGVIGLATYSINPTTGAIAAVAGAVLPVPNANAGTITGEIQY